MLLLLPVFAYVVAIASVCLCCCYCQCLPVLLLLPVFSYVVPISRVAIPFVSSLQKPWIRFKNMKTTTKLIWGLKATYGVNFFHHVVRHILSANEALACFHLSSCKVTKQSQAQSLINQWSLTYFRHAQSAVCCVVASGAPFCFLNVISSVSASVCIHTHELLVGISDILHIFI